jgi:hypothetical protein
VALPFFLGYLLCRFDPGTQHKADGRIRGSHSQVTISPHGRTLEPQIAAISRVSSTGPIFTNAFFGAKEE